MKKSVLLTGILALASISIAYSKSYSVDLAQATQVGTVQLQAGSYAVTVAGDKAIFKDVNTAKKYTVPVKVENAAKKFDYTMVDATVNGGVATLKDIQLGGSTTQIDF
jgi:uncharacterized protein YdbL (DUF1318 family)